MNCTGAGAVVVTCCEVQLWKCWCCWWVLCTSGFMHPKGCQDPTGSMKSCSWQEQSGRSSSVWCHQPHSSQALRVHMSFHSKNPSCSFSILRQILHSLGQRSGHTWGRVSFLFPCNLSKPPRAAPRGALVLVNTGHGTRRALSLRCCSCRRWGRAEMDWIALG